MLFLRGIGGGWKGGAGGVLGPLELFVGGVDGEGVGEDGKSFLVGVLVLQAAGEEQQPLDDLSVECRLKRRGI